MHVKRRWGGWTGPCAPEQRQEQRAGDTTGFQILEKGLAGLVFALRPRRSQRQPVFLRYEAVPPHLLSLEGALAGRWRRQEGRWVVWV